MQRNGFPEKQKKMQYIILVQRKTFTPAKKISSFAKPDKYHIPNICKPVYGRKTAQQKIVSGNKQQ